MQATDFVVEAIDTDRVRIWRTINNRKPGLRRSFLRRAMAPVIFPGYRWRGPFEKI